MNTKAAFLITTFSIFSSLPTELAYSQTIIGTIKSGETIYLDANHQGLPDPEFYRDPLNQLLAVVNQLISIKHSEFKKNNNEVYYDGILSDKKEGFQELVKYKVICSTSESIWPNIKIYFFPVAYKKSFQDNWLIHKDWPNVEPEWKLDSSNPYKSGEQWLFVNLAETACRGAK